MMRDNSDDIELSGIIVPCNAPHKKDYVRRTKKLIHTVKELGGTVYDVAAESGFLSAVHYMDIHYEDFSNTERADVLLVTEVYIRHETRLERVFVCEKKDVPFGAELWLEGEVQDGKFIVEAEKMQELFQNYYRRVPATYFWDDDYTFVGNGYNQALYIETDFERVLVMPDIYSVEESIRVVEAEALIKEKYEPGFFIEKIDYPEDIDTAYRRLTYQISYIKNLYADVYEQVWNVQEIEEVDIFNIPDAVLGIHIGEQVSYASCLMEDGSVKMVSNWGCMSETPDVLEYRFDGCGDICNAGVAYTKMARLMKKIYQAAEFMLNVCVCKTVLTFSGELPAGEEIAEFMEDAARTKLDLLAYEEVKSDDLDGRRIIERAAALAKLADFEIVESAPCVVAAYEARCKEYALMEGERAIVYHLDESYLKASLVQKEEDGSVTILAEQSRHYPEKASMRFEKGDFADRLGTDMKEFMLERGLRALGIVGERKNDREAFAEMLDTMPRVRRQLTRNDFAKLIFNNGYLSMMEEYPMERFAQCYQPVLRKLNYTIVHLFEVANLARKDVTRVFLAGECCKYPFVWEAVENQTGIKVSIVDNTEYTTAKGTVLVSQAE